MTRRHYTHADYVAVTSAFSYIVAKTIATVSEQTGVDSKTVKRIVADLEERGSFERRGNHYRYDSANDWRTTDTPQANTVDATPWSPVLDTPPPALVPVSRTSTVAPGRQRTRRSSKLSRDVAALLAMDGES